MRMSVHDRILLKVSEDSETGCWNWTGYIDPDGYGEMGIGKRHRVLVHRAAWEACGNSAIPIGSELHHVCENKACCNPSHLRVVTRREHVIELSPNNIAFKASRLTHCPYGHPLPDNYTPLGNGKRQRICKPCRNRRVKEFYLRNPEKYREHAKYTADLRRQKRLSARTPNPPKKEHEV